MKQQIHDIDNYTEYEKETAEYSRQNIMNGYGYDRDEESGERKINMLVTLGWLVVKAIAIAVFLTIAFGILGVK